LIAGKQDFSSEWRYGTQTPGATLKNCETLQPGTTYAVSVKTSFIGSMKFRVGEDSTVAELGGICGE